MVAFAGGLRRVLHSGQGDTWGPALITLFGIVLSGIFVMDPIRGYPPGAPSGDPAQLSWHHQLHDIAGIAVFVSLPAAALVLGRHFWSARTSGLWAVYSGATGVLMLGLFVAFAIAWEGDNKATGLIQRGLIIVGWAWISLLAVHLVKKLPAGVPLAGDDTEVLRNHPGSSTRR